MGQRGREKEMGFGSLGQDLQTQVPWWFGASWPWNPQQSFGAKLWWRWLKESANPWAKLWKQKYAKNWQGRDQIRMSGWIKGSHIWNLSWENRGIVQHHSFWEIQTRNLTRFWEDNWQQELNLFKDEFTILKNDTDNKGLLMVSDFWDKVRNNDKWRIWKDLGHNEDSPLKA